MHKKNISLIILVSLLGISSGFFAVRATGFNPATQRASVAIPSTAKPADVKQISDSIPQAKSTPTLEPPKAEVVKPKTSDCSIPKKKYEDYSYLDVGQTVAIPEASYVPLDLVLLKKSITTVPICLTSNAADAVTTMIAAAKKDGYTIKVSSGYRSYATQKSILDRNIKQGIKNATKLVAKPGYSEHQLGMAVDLTGASIQHASATTKFEGSVEAKWLETHAVEYGFVESYPEDKENITGYLHEAWHYRYVGIENASEIIKNNQTINEFLKAKKEAEKKIMQNKNPTS